MFQDGFVGARKWFLEGATIIPTPYWRNRHRASKGKIPCCLAQMPGWPVASASRHLEQHADELEPHGVSARSSILFVRKWPDAEPLATSALRRLLEVKQTVYAQRELFRV